MNFNAIFSPNIDLLTLLIFHFPPFQRLEPYTKTMTPPLTPQNLFCTCLCLFLATANMFFALQNLFGNYLGSVGQKFVYEMDIVFGGLLGIKNYSKIEGVLLFLAASGQVLVLSDKEICVVLNIFLMQLASIYYLLAIIYSYLRCFLEYRSDRGSALGKIF